MSVSAEIISEYLVKVGYLEDEKSRKEFEASVDKVGSALAKVAKRAVYTGAAIGGMSVAISSKLGALEQSARRLGTSSGNLRSLSKGFENLGMSADSAQAHISKLYDNLYGSQGKSWEKALKDVFKVDVRDANGQLKDTADLYLEIIKNAKGGGTAARERLMQWLGLDLDAANSALDGTLYESIRKARQYQQAFVKDYDGASERSLKLHKSLNNLTETFTLLQRNGIDKLTPSLTRMLDVATRGMQVLAKVTEKIALPAAEALADAAEGIEDKVKKSGAQTAGGQMYSALLPASLQPQNSKVSFGGLLAAPKAKGELINNPGNLRQGKGFAKYDRPEFGLGAMAFQLGKYRNSGLDTIEKIITTWAPPGENDTDSYIKDVAQRLGVNPRQKLDLTNQSVIHDLMMAMIHHEQGRVIYPEEMVRRQAVHGVTATGKLGDKTWNYHPTVNVTVNGSTDPAKTASLVGKETTKAVDSLADLRVESARNGETISFGSNSD